MATTSHENDFDRVKQSSKEFPATSEAGTQGTPKPQGDASEMTVRATRFNPPPGWPPAPTGWVAPPGWQPDPSWPEPPPGWQLWVEDRPAISPKAQDSLLVMTGGIAVVLGSLMPWVSFNSVGLEVKPEAKAASVVLGLVVMALGFALRVAPRPGRLVAGIATLCLSALVGLLYAAFILIGINGVPEQDLLGDISAVKFSPGIGIILAAAGCGAAFVAAIRSLQHR